MAKTLFYIGLTFVLGSLLWPYLTKLGLGHLPGDLSFKRDGYSVHFPVVTCIVLSIALSLLMFVIRKMRS